MRNVALTKPATQSSISQWSTGFTTEEDAGIATNGDAESDAFFHTEYEDSAWWQVDLQEIYSIIMIRIHNRRGFEDRLDRFTVLASSTGIDDEWYEIYINKSSTSNKDTLDLYPTLKSVARYIKIRKDEPGVLHLRQVDVFGKDTNTTEIANIQKNMDESKLRLIEERLEFERKHIDDRIGYIHKINHRNIFIDTEKYSKSMIDALNNGSYEQTEYHIVQKFVQPNDRILEVGTAIGVITMEAASVVSPENVVTYDANPAMIADAKRNFAANNMEKISANVGVMRNKRRLSNTDTTVDFFIAKDFWASRLDASLDSDGIVDVVKIPVVCFEQKLREHRANVLICDIEGGEADLLDGADLETLRLILLEIHYWSVGKNKINNMIRYLVTKGFNINFTYSGGSMVVLERGP